MKRRIEYINRAVYFVAIPDNNGLVYCSGVNISEFLPITRGRHKAMSNPAIRGLQIVNLEIRSMALKEGATPKTQTAHECKGMAPTDDIWYTESLYIKNPPDGFGHRIIEYAVTNLLKKIDKAIMLNAMIPEEFVAPDDLYSHIQRLCTEYGSK